MNQESYSDEEKTLSSDQTDLQSISPSKLSWVFDLIARQ